jgi:hypothetical protein
MPSWSELRVAAWRSAADSGGFSEDEAYDGDDGGIVLDLAFETKRIVIGATRSTWIFAACLRATFVNGAAARFGMEKLARFAEKRIFCAFEDARAVRYCRVFTNGFFDGNSKMVCKAFDIEIRDFDAFID